MYTDKKHTRSTKQIRSVDDVMDDALMQEGWTRNQLDAQKRTGDIIVELMAEGYAGGRLDAELQRRLLETEPIRSVAKGVLLPGKRQGTALDKTP